MIRQLCLTSAALALGTATAARAQSAPDPQAPNAEASTDIVVVGSRGTPRLRTDTPAPVDVLSGDTLTDQGADNLTRALSALSPSFNFVPAVTSPSAAGTRPATLRGLTPDQVLVLVNGHRRHAAAVINTNNGVGRGTVPVDLNTIPASAIERIEVLRDGAAAQYGSDAIAGVINIVLRKDAGGGYASLRGGATERGDGGTLAAASRNGFSIGNGGFLTVTSEFRSRAHTNAAAVDPRFGRVTQRLGDPRSKDANLALNSEIPLGANITAYAFATAAGRFTESTPLFRLPNVSPGFYPRGFLPLIRQRTLDMGGAVGLRGAIAGWKWDLSDTIGYNRADIRVANSVNTSLGAASPTSFDGGGQRYAQNIANLTIDRKVDLLAGANLAIGIEHRYEWYKLRKGEPLSYAGAGAQGFPGYNPPSPVHVDRHALSAFLDAELSLLPGLDLGGAVRYEDYSDFGSRTIWKGSLFWRPAPFAAVRGAISTGFRAPSLQQQYFSTVTSQLSNGVLVNVGNFAVRDPVSRALGASPLRAETSRNYSGGIVLTPMRRLDLSIDVYRIDIKNRITFSESLTGPAVTAILLANGITNASQVRFFTNAADTRSEGIEATLHWSAGKASTGLLDLSLGYGGFRNKLTRLSTNSVLPSLPLLGTTSIGVLVDSQPLSKITANAGVTLGAFHLNANVVNYGPFRAAPLGTVQRFGPKTQVDLTLGVDAGKGTRFDLGLLNLTNVFPDQVIGQTDGRLYTEAGGLNFNGREFFARFSIRY
ncbi:TonB-dependent receptor [Sphingomonas sp. MMSM20]|uniref:TonB-dependent receptor plug domain-containing protein n=1 Tax=Sphingomonas lycopersici TaxID=2951807 RepID=UPI0022379829|nr:TonB-dependent receptor [Sphingomonas lycopersici]MCW6530330.1 TonB-dependent receptor [Sphingomonas lycopersici]